MQKTIPDIIVFVPLPPPSFLVDILFCSATQAQGIKDQQDREYVRRFARLSWPRYWCPMMRHNILAAANDIREGVRAPGNGSTYRRLRHQAERKQLGKAAVAPGGCRGGLFWCCGVSMRCCGVSAAPTLPVPASVPNSCIGGEGGKQQQQQEGKWTLPPKLRAAARGAGSWGGETALISSRSTVARRPPSPTGPAHQRRRGSEATTVAGSMVSLGQQSGTFGAGSHGGVGGAGFGAGGGASGRGLISSVFCSTPIPVDEPRKKTFDGTGRSSGSLEHGGGSSTADFEGFAARSRGGDGASGRGLIASMFSTTSVAMDDAPRRHVYGTGHGSGVRSTGGFEGVPAAGGEGSSVTGAGEGGDLGRGGASGRGLFSGTWPVPLDAPQRKTYEFCGFAEARDEEPGPDETGSEGPSTGGG